MVYHFPQAADTTVCKTYDCSGQDRQQKYEQFFSYPHLTFHLIFLIPHDIPGSPADHRNNFSKRLPACFAVEWISEYEILSMFPDRSISPFSRFTRFTCRSVPQHSLLCLQQYLIQIKRQHIQNTCHQSCLPVIQYQFMVFLCCYRLQNYHNLSY